MYFWLKCCMIENRSMRNGYAPRLYVLRLCFYYVLRQMRENLCRKAKFQHERLTSRAIIPCKIRYTYPADAVWKSYYVLIAPVGMPTSHPCFCADSTSNLVKWKKKFWCDFENPSVEFERLYDLLIRFNVILLQLNKRLNFTPVIVSKVWPFLAKLESKSK